MTYLSRLGHLLPVGSWRALRAGGALIVVAAALAGCGSASTSKSASTTPASAASLSVSPATASVPVGGVPIDYSATVTGSANAGVTWQVEGVAGGNSTVGTISAAGLYLSPAKLPPTTAVKITAVSVANPSDSATAVLTLLGKQAAAAISVTPATIALLAGTSQTFAAMAADGSGPTVNWQVNGVTGGNSMVGTINAAGTYTAPAAPPAQSTVTITAVSVADPAKSGLASVTVVTTLSGGGTGAATVSWAAPTARDDGTPLTNLAGYRVYYGTEPGKYKAVIDVANPSISTYVVDNLPAGTYYFVATAYDMSGAESAFSQSASKTIQ